MSKHPGLNKKPGSWQEKERKKTGAKQSSRPKLRENPGHNKAIRANVPNSHPGLLLRTLEYVQMLFFLRCPPQNQQELTLAKSRE